MTEKNTRRRNAVIAAAAGAALLIGGSTYALWSATDNINGGTITAGRLDLTVGDIVAYDVSSDRTDSSEAIATPLILADGYAESISPKLSVSEEEGEEGALAGHLIDDTDTWMIVPGDTVAVTIPLEIILEGDNLVAALTLDATALTSINNADMAYSYAIFDQNGNQIGAAQELDTSEDELLVALFQASTEGQDDGAADTITVDGDPIPVPMVDDDGTADITLVVFGYFDYDSTNEAYMLAEDTLDGLPVTLTQVREGTDLFVTVTGP